MSIELTQDRWPFGPAPTAKCVTPFGHVWKVIDLYRAADPPMPTFECEQCGWKWSRGWTKAEFRRVILHDAASDPHYGDGSQYPDQPWYASLSPES